MIEAGCHRPGLMIGNCRIELRPHPMVRSAMFGCPKCGRDCYRLYQVADAWACRKCGGLDYSSRHEHRSIPKYARILYLRRRINAELRPFAPLPPVPRQRVARYHKIVAEIAALESNLIGYLGNINSDLKRRIRSRKAKSQW